MSNHRGMTHKTKARAIIVGVVAAAALGVGSVAIATSGTGQANQVADTHTGAHAGAAPEAASSVGNTGPLTETDKTFLVKVRQAGLWEIPAGRFAQTHASSEAVNSLRPTRDATPKVKRPTVTETQAITRARLVGE